MGIKHLFDIKTSNNKTIKELGHSFSQENMNNKKIAIDASIYIYNFLITKSKHSIHTNRRNSIYCILKKVFEFKSNKIEQIWVFDYYNRQNNNSKKIKINYDVANFKKDIQSLFKHLGVKYIISPKLIPAEKICVYMIKNGIVDYILSRDTDVLMYGSSFIYIQPRKHEHIYTFYDLNEILKALNFCHESFVLMCFCLGTDPITHDEKDNVGLYINVKNIGHKNISKYFQDADKLIDKLEKSGYTFDFLVNCIANYITDDISKEYDIINKENLNCCKYNREETKKFLVQIFKIDLENVLMKLENYELFYDNFNKPKQHRLIHIK